MSVYVFRVYNSSGNTTTKKHEQGMETLMVISGVYKDVNFKPILLFSPQQFTQQKPTFITCPNFATF